MKVSKLIERLQQMPPDADVFHLWDGELRTAIEHVWLSRDGVVGTADFNQVLYTGDSRPIDAPTEQENRYWSTPSQSDAGGGKLACDCRDAFGRHLPECHNFPASGEAKS